EPRGQVGQGHAGLGGRAVLVAGDADDPAHALGDEVVAASGRVRTRSPKATYGTVDEARVDLAQRPIPQPEPLRHAGPIVLDEHVGRLDQSPDRATPSGCLRSTARSRLPRFMVMKVARCPRLWTAPRCRVGSPSPGGSSLMTSAPISARFMVQNGAAMAWVKSITRRPARGFIVSGTRPLRSVLHT